VPGAQRASTAEARVPIADLGTTNEPEFGLTPSLELARLPLSLPDDATLAASTISYADAIRSDPAALRARINGRAVLIANTSIEKDIWPHAGGRQVSGVYAHAAALDALIDGRTLQQSSATMLFMEVVIAAIGTSIGLGSHRRRLIAVAATLGVGLAMTAMCAWAWFAGAIVLSPLVPAAALLVAFAAAAWIAPRRAARHQHIAAE
jgi:CHASE2 domain-containing sensor protein